MNTPQEELDRFLKADLLDHYVENGIDADLDAGNVVAQEPDDRGLIRVVICNDDAEVLAERWIAILDDPTAIDFGP